MRTFILTVSITLLLSAKGFAQQAASYSFFGSNSGYTTFQQQLAVSGLPALGTTFSVGSHYGRVTSGGSQRERLWTVSLVIGTSNQSWAGGALPVSLAPGHNEFSLLVSPDIVLTQMVTVPVGSVPPGAYGLRVPPPGTIMGPHFAITVPNEPALVGAQSYQQIVMADGGSITATNGGALTVGV